MLYRVSNTNKKNMNEHCLKINYVVIHLFLLKLLNDWALKNNIHIILHDTLIVINKAQHENLYNIIRYKNNFWCIIIVINDLNNELWKRQPPLHIRPSVLSTTFWYHLRNIIHPSCSVETERSWPEPRARYH